MGVLDALLPPVAEAADSMAKASTPEPFSKSRTSNWVARGGGLPAYIQHIAHDLMEKRGKSESNAIQMAIGIVKRWAAGGGKVDSGTRAAAAKAVAEWEKLKAGAKVQHSAVDPLSVVDAQALADAAEVRLFGLAQVFGTDGARALLEGDAGSEIVKLQEAASTGWAPELKRTASAQGEAARHEVHDGGQHVGTITQRPAFSRGEPDRWGAYAVNGDEIRDVGVKSQQDALGAIRKHLEEGPSRVQAHRNGKFLVAKPRTYGGATTYTEFPNEMAARHAAGLPAQPTAPEQAANAAKLTELAACDLALIEEFAPRRFDELWGPLLAGRGSGEPVPLAEAFQTALHPHGYHGHFAPTGGRARVAVAAMTRRVNSSPRLPVRPAPSSTHDPGRFRGPKLSDKQLVKAVEHGPWSAGARKVAGHLQRGLVTDTEHAHRSQHPGGIGSYSHERTQLHSAIIKAVLQGAGSHQSPQAHFMAGGPASGKSSLLKSGTVKLPKDHVNINPDIIKGMLPEYRHLLAAGDPQASSKVHEESAHIAKLATNIALHQKMHVVVDTTGNSGRGKFARKLMNAKGAGHQVHVHYADVATEVALQRAEARATNPKSDSYGRRVPGGFIRSAHRSVIENFHHDVQHLPVHVNVYDTTSKKPKRVASKTATGPLRVHDTTRYARIVSKAGVTGANA